MQTTSGRTKDLNLKRLYVALNYTGYQTVCTAKQMDTSVTIRRKKTHKLKIHYTKSPSLYVGGLRFKDKNNVDRRENRGIRPVIEIMDRLRAECPWDRKQTWDSLRSNTVEECFELCDAIISKDYAAIREELGDMLLHVVFTPK